MSGVGKSLKKALNVVTGGVFVDALTDKPDIKGAPEPEIAPVLDEKTRQQNAARNMQRRYAGKGRAGTILSGGGLG